MLVLSYNFYDDDVNLSIATVCKLTLELRNFFEGDFFFDVNRKTEECKINPTITPTLILVHIMMMIGLLVIKTLNANNFISLSSET